MEKIKPIFKRRGDDFSRVKINEEFTLTYKHTQEEDLSKIIFFLCGEIGKYFPKSKNDPQPKCKATVRGGLEYTLSRGEDKISFEEPSAINLGEMVNTVLKGKIVSFTQEGQSCKLEYDELWGNLILSYNNNPLEPQSQDHLSDREDHVGIQLNGVRRLKSGSLKIPYLVCAKETPSENVEIKKIIKVKITNCDTEKNQGIAWLNALTNYLTVKTNGIDEVKVINLNTHLRRNYIKGKSSSVIIEEYPQKINPNDLYVDKSVAFHGFTPNLAVEYEDPNGVLYRLKINADNSSEASLKVIIPQGIDPSKEENVFNVINGIRNQILYARVSHSKVEDMESIIGPNAEQPPVEQPPVEQPQVEHPYFGGEVSDIVENIFKQSSKENIFK